MTTNNNEIAETTTNTKMEEFSGRMWNLVLDCDSAFSDANYSLVESVVNLLVANTTKHRNVEKSDLNVILSRLKEMLNLNGGYLFIRNVDGDKIERIEFSKFAKIHNASEITANLISLLSLILKYDLWFNDTYSNYGGIGFCCEVKNDFYTVTIEENA